MKQIAVTISGKRYEITLEDAFADFVIQELSESGVGLDRDNKSDMLLKAYLRLARRAYMHEDEVEELIRTLDE